MGGLSHIPVLQPVVCSGPSPRGYWEAVGLTSPQLAFLLKAIYS